MANIFNVCLVLAGAFAASFTLTRLVIHVARSASWAQPVNSRSSHTKPTLTRGGVGFVVVIFVWLSLLYWPLSNGGWAFLGAGLIAIVGYLDDAESVSVLQRLVAQFLVTSASIIWFALTSNASNELFSIVSVTVLGSLLVLLWIWFINLFNFMDGIDGIASAEVVFVATVAAAFSLNGGQSDLASAWAVLSGACLGFLVWNAPPARIFMGDVGSGFLGFIVGGLLLLSIDAGVVSPWVALLLVIAFMGDATVTLLRRMLRGERWYEGHRQHAYQHLAIRWGSHGKVTLAYTAFNVLAVVPAVWLVNRHPDWAMWIVGVVAAIVMVLCLLAGAGAPATPTEEGPRPV